MLKKYLKNGMPSGVRIPGIKEGTVGMDDIPFDVGIARLRKAFERLKAGEESPFDSPAFGKMSHQDRIRLNLRHAELHLGHLAIWPSRIAFHLDGSQPGIVASRWAQRLEVGHSTTMPIAVDFLESRLKSR